MNTDAARSVVSPDWSRMPQLERFRLRVKVGERGVCWPWTGSTDEFGYGVMTWNGKRGVGAHRIAWFLEHGDWPAPGLDVCHHCDNPPCCNPACFFLGSQADNNRDARTKGRAFIFPVYQGSNHGRALVTDAQVAEIRTLYAAGGIRQSDLARRYGVGQTQISQIVRGAAWSHLDPTPVGRAKTRARRVALTEDQVREIRALHATGDFRQIDLAERFNTNQARISSIIRRQTWVHVA